MKWTHRLSFIYPEAVTLNFLAIYFLNKNNLLKHFQLLTGSARQQYLLRLGYPEKNHHTVPARIIGNIDQSRRLPVIHAP